MNPRHRQNGWQFFRLGLLAVAVIAICGMTAPAANAQGADRALDYLEQTDQLMDKARSAVDESGSQRGRTLYQNAVALQERAWEQYRRRMYRSAEMHSQKAREKAIEAIAATRSPEENENAVARQLERTDEVLDGMRSKLDEWVGRGRGMRAQASDSQFESLIRRQQTAWQHYHERRLRASLKLTLQVREQVARMTEQARRYRHGWSDTESALERMRDFIDHAREPVMESGLSKNIEMFQRAEHRCEQAREAYQTGQMSVAREHLRLCRELVNRSLAGIEEAANPEQVEELIKQAQQRWERIEGNVIESGDDLLRDLHRQAEDHLKRARNQLRQEKMVQALAHVRAAVGMLNQVEDKLP